MCPRLAPLAWVVFVLAVSSAVRAQTTDPPVDPQAVTDQLIVRLSAVNNPVVLGLARVVAARLDVKLTDTLLDGKFAVLKAGSVDRALSVLAELRTRIPPRGSGARAQLVQTGTTDDPFNAFLNVSPDYKVYALGAVKECPSSTCPSLYGMNVIKAPQVWSLINDTVSTKANVVPVVIDTGVRADHDELSGQVDAVQSRTCAASGIGACPVGGMDDHGHGTHVAGTIAALQDPAGSGGTSQIAGLVGQTQLVSCKFLDKTGSGAISDAIKCLDAVRVLPGPKKYVINNSWGGGGSSPALLEAMNKACAAGQLLVFAAGNEAVDTSTAYPAAYLADPTSGVQSCMLAVAATDSTNTLASFSNHGPSVNIAAPGVSILSSAWSATNKSATAYMSGTSMAAPHCAGAAALLWNFFPALTNTQLKDLLLAGATQAVKPYVSATGVVTRVDNARVLDVFASWKLALQQFPVPTGTTAPPDATVPPAAPSGCSADADCASSSSGRVCNIDTRQCVQCTSGNQGACGTSSTPCTLRTCDTTAFVCRDTAAPNGAQCSGGVCSAGRCVACITNAQCAGSAPYCSPGGRCVACTADAQCGGSTPVCNMGTNTCVQCTSGNSAVCTGSSSVCNTRTCNLNTLTCQDGFKANGASCASGKVCSNGVCGACFANAQCGGSTPVCNMGTNTCVQCTSGNSSACTGSSSVCNTRTCNLNTLTCQDGFKTNGLSCASGKVCTNGVCGVPCVTLGASCSTKSGSTACCAYAGVKCGRPGLQPYRCCISARVRLPAGAGCSACCSGKCQTGTAVCA